MIVPDVSQEQASYVMERLREMFSRYRDLQAPELRVSLSIGLASYQPQFTPVHMWLNAADQALYAAKGTGSNRVTVAESVIARSACTYADNRCERRACNKLRPCRGLRGQQRGFSRVLQGHRSIVDHCLMPMIRARHDPR